MELASGVQVSLSIPCASCSPATTAVYPARAVRDSTKGNGAARIAPNCPVRLGGASGKSLRGARDVDLVHVALGAAAVDLVLALEVAPHVVADALDLVLARGEREDGPL